MKAADDYAAIAARMAELKGEPPRTPICSACMDGGWENTPSSVGWVRICCRSCGNPEGKP